MPPPKLVPNRTILRFWRTFSQKESKWRRFSSGPREAGEEEEADEEKEEEADEEDEEGEEEEEEEKEGEEGEEGEGEEEEEADEEEEGEEEVAFFSPALAKPASEVKPHPIRSGHQHSTPRSASRGSNLLNSRHEESKPWRQTTGGRGAPEGGEEEEEEEDKGALPGPTNAVSKPLETPSTGSSTLRILEMKARAAGSVTLLPNSRGMNAGMLSPLSVVGDEEEEEVEVEEEAAERLPPPCRRRSTIGRRRDCCGRVAATLERGIAYADDPLAAEGRVAAKRMALEEIQKRDRRRASSEGRGRL